MSSRKIVIFKSYIRQKSKFQISGGMKPTTRLGEIFLRLFSFQDLISGLISTTAIFLFCLY